jgi:S-adenosylmethionine synthetase
MTQVCIEELASAPLAQQPLEIVERKGLGHPDFICDAVLEHASVALSRAYRERLGHVLHYNMDKGLLAAGSVEHRFGGGQMLRPMRLIIGDRATFDAEGQHVPVRDIAEAATREWFQQYLPRIDLDQHVILQSELRPSSAELAGIFERTDGRLVSNDTSALVGFAPMTETERAVLETERFLNSRAFKQVFPDTGEDVKVMGIRRRNQLSLTVAMPSSRSRSTPRQSISGVRRRSWRVFVSIWQSRSARSSAHRSC